MVTESKFGHAPRVMLPENLPTKELSRVNWLSFPKRRYALWKYSLRQLLCSKKTFISFLCYSWLRQKTEFASICQMFERKRSHWVIRSYLIVAHHKINRIKLFQSMEDPFSLSRFIDSTNSTYYLNFVTFPSMSIKCQMFTQLRESSISTFYVMLLRLWGYTLYYLCNKIIIFTHLKLYLIDHT